ncbi:hypothetical protein [Marivita sp.]|uniref:hypothetical protein n=1 Tax=Marivita sp. TaxID=2003365 RepID=UPI00262663EF|nr:hypothetical protein [Marivita sp.]
MRLALLIFALIASPAFARDVPPEPPTYDKPTFERPSTPPSTPPNGTPQNPEDPDDKPRPVKSVPKPAPVSCPKVKCVTDENGHRRAMFTADVQPDMYYLGRNFCATAPKDVEVTACCLEKEDHTYQILYNVQVSKKAHWKAKQFCTCVLELD